MAIEREGYREQLAELKELFPGKIALTVQETAKVLGVDRRAVNKLIRDKKLGATNINTTKANRRYVVSLTVLARFLAG